MTRRAFRWLTGFAAACVVGAGAVALPSCSAPPMVRHLTADQNSLTEVGRAMDLSELTLRLHDRYQITDPARWRAMATRAGQLSQSAGHLLMSRATAVAGSTSDAEQFYSHLDSDTAALRTQREALAADLTDAIPKPRP